MWRADNIGEHESSCPKRLIPCEACGNEFSFDEFVDHLLKHAPTLVKSRVSYGQSTGGGRPDYFYVINPEESTQGALSAEIKQAQKRDNVQICRISVPEHADVDALLQAMEGFFDRKYQPRAG